VIREGGLGIKTVMSNAYAGKAHHLCDRS